MAVHPVGSSPDGAVAASTAERLVAAAFEVFAERGFDAATIDEIASRAGVSRRTFFRHFRTKEDVIFPDHDRLLARVRGHLEEHPDDPPLDALLAAVSIVLLDYVRTVDISTRRYALTSVVPALRERELGSIHDYQRLFLADLRRRLPAEHPTYLEIVAAGVVTAHNTTLRRWLRNPTADPMGRLEEAFDILRASLAPPVGRARPTGAADRSAGATVAVFSVDTPMEEVVRALRQTERHSRKR